MTAVEVAVASIGSGMREEKLDDFARFSHKATYKFKHAYAKSTHLFYRDEHYYTYEVEKVFMYERNK